VVEYVRKCWSSLYTPRAIYYRVRQGFRHEDVSIAVVVQKMVNSEKSGVMFSSHPVTGDPVVMIEAVWGLGEAIVSGMVSPDHYEFDRVSRKITKVQVSKKDKAIVREGDETKVIDLPPEKAEARVLSDRLKKLRRQKSSLEDLELLPELVWEKSR